MNIYETIWMLAAIEELPLEHTFFKSRYFPTDDMMDVFNTSKVLADYREGKRKKAPFVVPRIGSLPVGREGFKTYELEPAYIGLSMPLTIDQLNKRGFGESIMSGMTPEERAKHLQLHDMEELSARISRTEEWMACQTMLNNGCVMRHETDVEGVYEDVEVKFYDEETNPALFTPAAKWTHSTISTKGEITVGNWYEDIYQMLVRQKRRGMPATDLLVSSDVGAFLMEDPWVLRMLDNRLSIVLIRGEAPVIDAKYDLTRHPNIKRTADGGAAPYTHNACCLYDVGDLDFTFTSLDEIEIIENMEESL